MQQKKQSHKLIVAVFIVVVIVGVVVFATYDFLQQPQVIMPSGTNFSLSAGQILYYPFSTSFSRSISGSFTSQQPISIYVTKSSNFSGTNRNFLSSYTYCLENVTSGNLNATIPPGSYDLVFANLWKLQTISVQITSSIIIGK